MLRDLHILLWLEAKRAKPVIVYWLKTLGCDPATSKGYQLYVLAFWGVWLYLTGAYVVDTAFRASAALPPDAVPLLLQAIPYLLFAGQLLYLAALLREPPLRLTVPEMTHSAASPVSRRLITFVHFGRAVLMASLPIASLSALVSATLTHITAPTLSTMAGIQGFLVAFPLLVISMALAWAVAALALRPSLYRRRGWLWLSLPLLLLVAVIAPPIMLWPGIVWRATIGATLAPAILLPLLAAMVVALLLLAGAGNANMSIVAERSQTYARLEKLGFLGRLYAQDLIRRIERQSELAQNRRLWPSLSATATGNGVVRSRTLVALVRPSWTSVLRPFGEGAFLTSLLAGVVSVGGATFQTGLLLLVVLLVVRLSTLVQFFQQELHLPFMRQVIPTHPAALFAATAWWPGVLVTLGGGSVILSQTATIPLAAALLVPMGVAALGLAQALDRVNTGFLTLCRLPYFYTVLFSGGLVVGLSLFFKSLIVAFVLLLLVNGVLASLLYNSRLMV